MKSIQMMLFSYFLMKDEIKEIQMINARNKLKAYKGPKISCDIKETYKKNKFLAIKYTDIMIRENNKIDKKYHTLFDTSKKKDDLSDSYHLYICIHNYLYSYHFNHLDNYKS